MGGREGGRPRGGASRGVAVALCTDAGRVLVPAVRTARGLFGRALGLMGRPGLPAGEGLLLSPCRAVHTAFMRFPLDLVFIDRSRRVVRVVRGARPWRVFRGGRTARAVIESAAGALPAGEPAAGDRVRFSSAPESIAGK